MLSLSPVSEVSEALTFWILTRSRAHSEFLSPGRWPVPGSWRRPSESHSDEAENFLFSLNAQAFQGGIELNDIVIGVDGIDSSLTMADIQPGVTVTIQRPFLLRDDSTVKVEVREQFSFTDDILASQEFSVSPWPAQTRGAPGGRNAPAAAAHAVRHSLIVVVPEFSGVCVGA